MSERLSDRVFCVVCGGAMEIPAVQSTSGVWSHTDPASCLSVLQTQRSTLHEEVAAWTKRAQQAEAEVRASRAAQGTRERAEKAEKERDELAATWAAIAEGERKDVIKALAERDAAREREERQAEATADAAAERDAYRAGMDAARGEAEQLRVAKELAEAATKPWLEIATEQKARAERAESERDAAREEAGRLRDLLREVEWVQHSTYEEDWSECPVCGAEGHETKHPGGYEYLPGQHNAGCPLAAALAPPPDPKASRR